VLPSVTAAVAGADEAGGAVAGSPVHVQLQIQLHEQTWSNEKLLVTPFVPVQFQFQIQ
jgi:hypothetical protein